MDWEAKLFTRLKPNQYMRFNKRKTIKNKYKNLSGNQR